MNGRSIRVLDPGTNPSLQRQPGQTVHHRDVLHCASTQLGIHHKMVPRSPVLWLYHTNYTESRDEIRAEHQLTPEAHASLRECSSDVATHRVVPPGGRHRN